MSVAQEILATGTVTCDGRLKDSPFDSKVKNICFFLALDEQDFFVGAGKVKNGCKSSGIWIAIEEKKTRNKVEEFTKGVRVVVNLRLSGVTKTDKLPSAYYVNTSYCAIAEKGSCNIMTTKCQIHIIAPSSPIPGTTKLLLKEPKRKAGNNKDKIDYTKLTGWNFYPALANGVISENTHKLNTFYSFVGRLCKGIFDSHKTGDAVKDKILDTPILLLDKCIR